MKKIFIIVSLFFLSGCNSWLDVKPEDQLTEDQTFSSPDGFKNALNAIYIEMARTELYGKELTVGYIEVLAGRYFIQQENAEYLTVYQHKYTESSPMIKAQQIWEKMYNLIANLNILIRNFDKHPNVIKGPEHDIVKGEALALRAFIHFELFRLFGPIYDAETVSLRYYHEFNYDWVSVVPSTCAKFMEYTLADITASLTLLEKSDPIITKPPTFSNDVFDYFRNRQTRMNYYAVKLLHARAALWMKDTETATTVAKELIEISTTHFPFSTEEQVTNISLPDRIFTSEILFAVQNDKRPDMFKKTIDESQIAASSLLGSFGDIECKGVLWGTYAGSLTSTTESGYNYDLRAKSMTSTKNTSSGVCYISHKYAPVDDIDELPSEKKILYSLMPLMRISEAYYIVAECEYEPSYLDQVTKARLLPKDASYMNLDRQILREYIKDFYMEGQLFYYYKRFSEKFQMITNGKGENILDMKGAYVIPIPKSENP